MFNQHRYQGAEAGTGRRSRHPPFFLPCGVVVAVTEECIDKRPNSLRAKVTTSEVVSLHWNIAPVCPRLEMRGLAVHLHLYVIHCQLDAWPGHLHPSQHDARRIRMPKAVHSHYTPSPACPHETRQSSCMIMLSCTRRRPRPHGHITAEPVTYVRNARVIRIRMRIRIRILYYASSAPATHTATAIQGLRKPAGCGPLLLELCKPYRSRLAGRIKKY